jgi:hypothetical protein
MRPTDPKPDIPLRDTETLVEDLFAALRDVGVHDWDLTASDLGLKAIQRVKDIDAELRKRDTRLEERLAELVQQTGWNLVELLSQCREYPEVRPRLRERDGIRRAFRCAACQQAEFPGGTTNFQLCDGCLRILQRGLLEPRDFPNMFLFKSFTTNARCEHADADTVLGIFPWYVNDTGVGPGFCSRCVEREFARRAG